ncbi:hypothetical protein BGX33_008278 [Mortierella sp. NVP41]|nr:hypothetical protein BGX33_008278 [Mortierella sp. NVP41]
MIILRLLPPLSKATALTDDNWRHFVVHHLMTDLQHVESVNIKHNTSDRWLDTVRKHPSFLQRCRTLKQLSMASLGPGSFNWAVQEKLDMEGTRNYHNTIGDFDNGHASATQTAFQQHSLIPLADVNIREGNTPIKDEVDDIAFAFSQTLQSLAVLASDSIRDPTRRIHIGKGWVDLPLLTSLSLDGSRARLVTDSRLLSHCPNVVSVMLGDKTMEYRCQEIVSSQPAHLARLDTLFLTGQSALTFHPATLDSTQSLASLSLTVSERPGIFCFIPPVEELDRSYGVQSNSGATATVIDSGPAIIRPHWSWDWDLPRLHTLRLGAEFAYRFEFRMLQGCPALEALGLDIRMINGQHTRVITEADMFVTAGSDTTEGSGVGTVEPSRRRIVAPSIRAFAMHGCWSIEDNLLEGFLMDMFPNLEDLSERYWKEVTLEGLLKLVRKRSDNKLKKVHMDLAYPSEDEMLRHRFYPFHKVKGRAVLPTKFCFVRAQHHRYVLLHDTEPL